MKKGYKGKICSKITMRDTNFGISLDCGEQLPIGAEAMLVTVLKKEPIKSVCLPHQLYLNKLIEISEGGKYQVTIEPHYNIKKIKIFEELKYKRKK